MIEQAGTGKKKRGRGCIVSIFALTALIFLAIIILFIVMSKNVKSYDDMDYSSLNLSNVEDGTYTGSEDGGMVKAKVQVTVADHKITKVTIVEHDCGRGKPAEAIMEDIVKNNTVEVDGVSGATLSSNVLKTAVYNALTKQGQ